MNMHILPNELRQLIKGNKPLNPDDMIALREHIPHIPDISEFDRVIADTTVREIVKDDGLDDFSTVWQYGRLLHNAGRTHDALFYLEAARNLDPQNHKAAGRVIEALLDLNVEMPNRGYEEPAMYLAQELHREEQSEYSAELLARAQAAFSTPMAAFEAHLS